MHKYTWGPEVDVECSPLLFSALFLKTGYLPESRAHHLASSGWLENCGDLPISIPPSFSTGNTVMPLHLAFYSGPGGSNSRPYACTAGTLSQLPSPQYCF